MKSIFVGDKHSIDYVYSEDVKQTLSISAGLDTENVLTKDAIISNPELSRDADYIFSTWGMPSFSRDEIKVCFPKVKACFYAAGTVKDFAYPFLDSNIRIFSAWQANAVPVAEYTVAQIILANKGFFSACAKITDPSSRKAASKYASSFPGNYGCSVGIIGAGMIGRMVIKMLKSYNLKICVFDPFLSDSDAATLSVEKASLKEMFENCQTISNHVPNLPSTVGMLDYNCFSSMKSNGTFINTGRGAQVLENDLLKALKECPDRTAVLDVTMPEPPEEGSELYTLPNVFLTPHMAGSSGNEVIRMSEYMVTAFNCVIDNLNCDYEIDKSRLETMA